MNKCHAGSPNHEAGRKPKSAQTIRPVIPINPPRFGSALKGEITSRIPIPIIGATWPIVVVSPPRKAPERATRAANTAVNVDRPVE
jgi:hypothetical protein